MKQHEWSIVECLKEPGKYHWVCDRCGAEANFPKSVTACTKFIWPSWVRRRAREIRRAAFVKLSDFLRKLA